MLTTPVEPHDPTDNGNVWIQEKPCARAPHQLAATSKVLATRGRLLRHGEALHLADSFVAADIVRLFQHLSFELLHPPQGDVEEVAGIGEVRRRVGRPPFTGGSGPMD